MITRKSGREEHRLVGDPRSLLKRRHLEKLKQLLPRAAHAPLCERQADRGESGGGVEGGEGAGGRADAAEGDFCMAFRLGQVTAGHVDVHQQSGGVGDRSVGSRRV